MYSHISRIMFDSRINMRLFIFPRWLETKSQTHEEPGHFNNTRCIQSSFLVTEQRGRQSSLFITSKYCIESIATGWGWKYAFFSTISSYVHCHSFIFIVYCIGHVTDWRGQELITMSGRFDQELFRQLCVKYRPQSAHLVPPILLHLAKNHIIDKYDLSSLNTIISAAAPHTDTYH